MAFPRDSDHVVSYLRAIYMSHAEADVSNTIFMVPPPIHGVQEHLFHDIYQPESPPITFNMLDHLNRAARRHQQKPGRGLTGNKVRGRKKGLKREKGRNKGGTPNGRIPLDESETKTTRGVDGTGSDTEEATVEKANLLDTSDPSFSPTERKKTKTGSKTSKNMARFVPRLRFVNPSQQKGSEHDLELIEEEAHDAQSTQQQHVSDGEYVNETNTTKESSSVPGGFETVPMTRPAFPERNRQSSLEFSISSNEAHNQTNGDDSDTTELNEDDTFDYDYDDDDDEEEDDDDDYDDEDEEADDVSSSDSAFTDIEADSVIDSSLLYPFDNESGFPFDNNNVLESKRSRRKKLRMNSYEENNDSSGTSRINSQAGSMSGSLPIKRSKSVQFRSQFVIEKVEPRQASHLSSNLSSLISSKASTTNRNPLEYYGFVGNLGGTIVKISIYLPPSTSPTLNVTVNTGVAVSDCIGFILLNLFKEEKLSILEEMEYMNPNFWRLELVDEDGENYGSFGILDRTRLLSSYNNPTELALCKIANEGEYKRNEQQSPLPMEFLLALEEYRRNQKLHKIEDQTSPTKDKEGALTEIKILRSIQSIKFPQYDIFTIFLPLYSTVQDALNEFCSLHGLDPSRHTLREMFLSGVTSSRYPQATLDNHDLTSPSAWEIGRVLSKSEIITNTTEAFEIVTEDNNVISVGNETFLNAGITPAFSTPLRSSPQAQLTTTLKSMSMDDGPTKEKLATKKTSQGPSVGQKKSNEKDLIVLDEIIRGKNVDLPTNLNTVYFKWKVWRRKATLLNRIEKSLIIDGDYIHLAPSDEAAWKVNPNENSLVPGMQHSGSTHYHNYLHHYNYSNYYNKLMMKTSSFHVTQIVKLKRYPNKSPNHFKIVINKQPGKTPVKERDSNLKKKYDLEAGSPSECEEIIEKIKWVLQVYNMSNLNG
jgi:hypothetical protein